MAQIPERVTVTLELDSAVVAQIKQLVREEIAMWAAASLTAAVDRRDWCTTGAHQ